MAASSSSQEPAFVVMNGSFIGNGQGLKLVGIPNNPGKFKVYATEYVDEHGNPAEMKQQPDGRGFIIGSLPDGAVKKEAKETKRRTFPSPAASPSPVPAHLPSPSSPEPADIAFSADAEIVREVLPGNNVLTNVRGISRVQGTNNKLGNVSFGS